MVKKLLAFKANIWLFSLGCYGIGLISLSAYYFAFDVPIIYYLSLNDMLLYAITLIVPVVVVVFLFDFLIFGTLKIFVTKYIIKREFNKGEESAYYLICTVCVNTLMLLVAYFNTAKNNPDLYFFILISSMMLSAALAKKNDSKNLLIPAVLALVGLFLGINSLVKNTKVGISNKDVKFKYENKIIGTRYYSSLSYIGETSNTMFLYDLESNATFVYEKSKISNLIYLDKLKSQDWQKGKLKYYQLKDAKLIKENDTVSKKYVWITSDNKTFSWKSENTPNGVAIIIRQLENVLRVNGFDIDLPVDDTSSTPDNFNLKENNVALNNVIASGHYEVNKWWAHPTGYIHFTLEKDLYIIEIIYQRVPNLEKDPFYK